MGIMGVKKILYETNQKFCKKLSGTTHPFYVKKRPKEEGEKISKGLLGKKHNEERIRKRRRIYEHFVLISPDGLQYTRIENIVKFCDIHRLCRPHLLAVLNGKRKSHKGWKCTKHIVQLKKRVPSSE